MQKQGRNIRLGGHCTAMNVLPLLHICKCNAGLHMQEAHFHKGGAGTETGVPVPRLPVDTRPSSTILPWWANVDHHGYQLERMREDKRDSVPQMNRVKSRGYHRLLGGHLSKSVLSCGPSPTTLHLSHQPPEAPIVQPHLPPIIRPSCPGRPDADYMCVLLLAAESDQ